MSLADDYRRDGYVVCHGLVSPDVVEQLRDETLAIACGRRGLIEGVTAGGDSDESALADVLAIHFPHKISPLVRAMLAYPAIVEVLQQLVGPDVKCMQSMLFVKNAGMPGQAWHQDETFIPVPDHSLIGVWIALEEATIDNGCIWVQPGSQAPGVLWPSQPCTDPRFDGAPESVGWHSERWPREGGVAAQIPAGSVLFFNGLTLHRSLNNRQAAGFRRALVNHYMSARCELPWGFVASKFAPHDFRDIVMVAGVDPFADRGLEDLSRPYLRPKA